jgi:hypothetical protein
MNGTHGARKRLSYIHMAVALAATMLLPAPPALHGLTHLAELPPIDLYTAMPRIIATADEVVVVPSLEGGSVSQLVWNGWQWALADSRPLIELAGFQRVHPPWVFAIGDTLLMVDTTPPADGLWMPRVAVLTRQGSRWQLSQLLDAPPQLPIADLYSVTVIDIVAHDPLLIIKLQLGVYGMGGVPYVLAVHRTADGWQWAPAPEVDNPWVWWPVALAHAAEGDVLYAIESRGSLEERPVAYAWLAYAVDEPGMPLVGEYPFLSERPMAYGSDRLTAQMSPDGESCIVFGIHGMLELRRDGELWSARGQPDFGVGDPRTMVPVAYGPTAVLLRSGGLASDPGVDVELEPQRYHLLVHEVGAWRLRGDLPSHRLLGLYDDQTVMCALSSDHLTIFDFDRWAPVARRYTLPDLEPALIPWFRQATLDAAGGETVPRFGTIASVGWNDPRGTWLWHEAIGWGVAVGRDADGFWLWLPDSGWSWCDAQLFDTRTPDRHWLVCPQRDDNVWLDMTVVNPRWFYSARLGEWLTDTRAAEASATDLTALATLLVGDMTGEGMSFEVDGDEQRVVFTFQEVVDNKLATVTIASPWSYRTGEGYACQSRFEIDMSSIHLRWGTDEVWVQSTELWTQSNIVLPTRLVIDFIFYAPEAGVFLQWIEYNNGVRDPPERSFFAGRRW